MDQVVVLEVGDSERVVLSDATNYSSVSEVFDVYSNKQIGKVQGSIFYQSKMELVELAHKGVRAKSVRRLTELLSISIKQASTFFHFSERALNAYIKDNKILDIDSSEKVLKIFSLYLYGCNVFGNRQGYINWLKKPSFGLRNKIPTELLFSSDGIDLVQEELSRLAHGDFA